MNVDDFPEPPDRKDFRRLSGGVPYVLAPNGNKRERYSRASSAGKILDDESNLIDWKIRTTVYGAAQRPELMAMVSTLNQDSDKRKIRDIADQCLEAGRGLKRSIQGTAVHSMFDHIDRGDDWEPSPRFLDLCVAYQQWLRDWGLDPVAIEQHCVNDRFRIAGTFDRIYRTLRTLVTPTGQIIPIGSRLLADFKTGQSLEYVQGTYSTQLAAYAGSCFYDVETDERTPFDPPIFPTWALIVWADSEGSTVEGYWVDLEAGNHGLMLAASVREWRKRTDLLTPGRPPEAAQCLPEASYLAGRTDALRERVRAILSASEAAGRELVARWPVGVPTLKSDGLNELQLDAIERAICSVEDQWSMPFIPDYQPTERQRDEAEQLISDLPRGALILGWIKEHVRTNNRDRVIRALQSWASIPEAAWSNEDLQTCLDAALRAIGYQRGIQDLDLLKVGDRSHLLAAAVAIETNNVTITFDAQGYAYLTPESNDQAKEMAS